MRKLLILILISVIIISTSFIFLYKKSNNLSTETIKNSTNTVDKDKNKSTNEIKDDVVKNREKLDDDKKVEKKQNSDDSNNNIDNSQAVVTEEKSTNITTKSSSNNQETKSQNNSGSSQTVTNSSNNSNQNNSNDGNLVNKNTIDYSFHKGRTEKQCNSESSCRNQAIDFYTRNKKVVASFSILDVITNNGNILGYFIEYVFKEGEFDTEGDCNNIGVSIKNELSDRVVGFKCSNRNGKYYLNITTDYD